MTNPLKDELDKMTIALRQMIDVHNQIAAGGSVPIETVRTAQQSMEEAGLLDALVSGRLILLRSTARKRGRQTRSQLEADLHITRLAILRLQEIWKKDGKPDEFEQALELVFEQVPHRYDQS